MANEIQFSNVPSLANTYAVKRFAGQVYNHTSNAFENWATANLATYKVTTSENGDGGGLYVADFDAESDGFAANVYKLEHFNSSDTKIGIALIDWDGTAEVTVRDNSADIALILEDTGELQTNQGNWTTATSVTVSDKTGFSLSTAGILAIWHQLTAAVVTASTMGKLIIDYLNAAISTRATAAAVVTAMETDGSKLDHLWETTADDAGVRQFTTHALELGPAGGSVSFSRSSGITVYSGSDREYAEGEINRQSGITINNPDVTRSSESESTATGVANGTDVPKPGIDRGSDSTVN